MITPEVATASDPALTTFSKHPASCFLFSTTMAEIILDAFSAQHIHVNKERNTTILSSF
jgi:hypothetical protein